MLREIAGWRRWLPGVPDLLQQPYESMGERAHNDFRVTQKVGCRHYRQVSVLHNVLLRNTGVSTPNLATRQPPVTNLQNPPWETLAQPLQPHKPNLQVDIMHQKSQNLPNNPFFHVNLTEKLQKPHKTFNTFSQRISGIQVIVSSRLDRNINYIHPHIFQRPYFKLHHSAFNRYCTNILIFNTVKHYILYSINICYNT